MVQMYQKKNGRTFIFVSVAKLDLNKIKILIADDKFTLFTDIGYILFRSKHKHPNIITSIKFTPQRIQNY